MIICTLKLDHSTCCKVSAITSTFPYYEVPYNEEVCIVSHVTNSEMDMFLYYGTVHSFRILHHFCPLLLIDERIVTGVTDHTNITLIHELHGMLPSHEPGYVMVPAKVSYQFRTMV